ncbi:MAG TPA: ATP-binding protein [Bacteroidetes bacterium]|nr:ATP-binding protein [Bacteroidota bacterium]
MPLFEITEEQVLNRIRFENPWWIDEKIDEYYRSMKRRLYFSKFFPLVKKTEVKRATVLMGPRRVGKTVMIFHVIQELIDEGIDPKKIFYLSIETPIFNGIGIEALFNSCRKAVGKEDDLKGYYVFFDEVQYLKDWEVHLKSLVDSYHHVKFIVSGSAAAALKLKSNESGAGRFTDFTLPPLTFHEYIHLKDLGSLIIPKQKKWNNSLIDIFSTVNIDELNNHFIDYINFGGYPEVSLSKEIQANPGRYIKSDIIDKVLLRDLPSLYGIQDVQELNSLFTTIAFNSGNEFSFDNLSVSSGVSKSTIRKYISYLEAAFLIRVVKRIDLSGKKFKRANYFKIYLTNPSLRSALFSPINMGSKEMGNMVETAIYSQWFHRYWHTPYYARWKGGEVDIVGLTSNNLKPAWAVEIKWSNRYFEKPGELKSLSNFLIKNKIKRAIVTTISITGEIELQDFTLDYMPSSLYCYTIGRRTLQ